MPFADQMHLGCADVLAIKLGWRSVEVAGEALYGADVAVNRVLGETADAQIFGSCAGVVGSWQCSSMLVGWMVTVWTIPRIMEEPSYWKAERQGAVAPDSGPTA